MPSPTTIASGVARPKAQGHATTRTDINVLILVFRDFVISFNLIHYAFSSSNFFINSTSFSTPSMGIAL